MKYRGDTSKISNHHYSLPLCPPVIISLLSWHVCTSSSSTHRHTHSCFAYFQIFRKESNQVHRDHHRDSSRLLPQEAPRADAVVRVHEARNRGAGQLRMNYEWTQATEIPSFRLSFVVHFELTSYFMWLRATMLGSFYRYWSSRSPFRCWSSKRPVQERKDKKFHDGWNFRHQKWQAFKVKWKCKFPACNYFCLLPVMYACNILGQLLAANSICSKRLGPKVLK